MFSEMVEGFSRERLHVNGEVGLIKVDRPAFGLLDPAADFALDLWRREREPLVGALRRNPECRDLQLAEEGKIIENRGRDDIDVERDMSRERKVRDAEHMTKAIGNGFPRVR